MNHYKKTSSRWGALLLCLALCTIASAQTIHWITFIDTSDLQLGVDNQNGKRALDKHLIQRVNAALIQKGYTPRYYNYTGKSVTASVCNSVTNSLTCGPRDIVVFYYIGHGGRPETAKDGGPNSMWPEMEFADNSQKYLSLNTVHQRLKGKHPQMLLTVGMCCNVERPTHNQSAGLTAQSRRNKIVNKGFAKKLQHLFVGHRGDIILAAASPREEAQGGYKGEEGEMDYFTGTLCWLMDSYATADSNESLTWSRIVKDVTYWTNYYVKSELRLKQTPHGVINAHPIE